MIVYMTQGQKTVLSRITVEGLPLHYLSVGRGYFARRRALHCLRQMYDSGVRRCICADVYLLSLAKQVDITSYPVLPLRLACWAVCWIFSVPAVCKTPPQCCAAAPAERRRPGRR